MGRRVSTEHANVGGWDFETARKSTTSGTVKISIATKRTTAKALRRHCDYRCVGSPTRKLPTILKNIIQIRIEKRRFGAAMKEGEPTMRRSKQINLDDDSAYQTRSSGIGGASHGHSDVDHSRSRLSCNHYWPGRVYLLSKEPLSTTAETLRFRVRPNAGRASKPERG